MHRNVKTAYILKQKYLENKFYYETETDELYISKLNFLEIFFMETELGGPLREFRCQVV